MSSIFNTVFYQPLLNALGVLIFLLPGASFGGAVIILTLLVNVLLLPFTHKMKHSQKKIQELQPELENIKRKFKDKKEEIAKRTLELYREHGINPFSSFLLIFIQLPLFFALFKILRNEGVLFGSDVYSFLPAIPEPNTLFLGLINLGEPSIVLAAFAAIAQFFQFSLMPQSTPGGTDKESFAAVMQKSLRFAVPLGIFFIGIRFPAALVLYLITMSAFGIVHEVIVRFKAQRSTENNGENARAEKVQNP